MVMKRLTLLVVAAVLLVLTAAIAPTTQASAAWKVHGRGRVCNHSSVNVWIIEKVGIDLLGNGGHWQSRTLAPGACSDTVKEDVDAIWGKQCDRNNRCNLQAWKVGDGSFTVDNGFLSPLPPGRALFVHGFSTDSGWSIDAQWRGYAPNLNAIQYELRR